MRIININLSADEYGELIENTDYEQVENAIAYLTTWGLLGDRFNTVHIHLDLHSKTDLIALYTNDDEARSRGAYQRFTMGAVWRRDERKFTFHS